MTATNRTKVRWPFLGVAVLLIVAGVLQLASYNALGAVWILLAVVVSVPLAFPGIGPIVAVFGAATFAAFVAWLNIDSDPISAPAVALWIALTCGLLALGTTLAVRRVRHRTNA